MKQITSVVVFTVMFLQIFSWRAYSRNDLSEPYRVYFRDKIFSLHVSDESRWWATGNMGLILTSADGGETWRRVESVSDHALYDITFVGEKGWIVGEGGIILHSRDNGNQWEKQSSGHEVSFMQVFFLDQQRGVIVGFEGALLWTEDGGSSWQSPPLNWVEIVPDYLLEKGIFPLKFYDVFFVDEVHGWAVGDAGLVLFSSDGGKNWDVQRIGLFPPLYSVCFKDQLKGWAIGPGGHMIHTQDGGNSWCKMSVPTEADLFKITMGDNYGVVVGDLGTMLLTGNGGRSWDLEMPRLRPPLPWLMDAGIISHNSPVEVFYVGLGVLKKWAGKKPEEQ